MNSFKENIKKIISNTLLYIMEPKLQLSKNNSRKMKVVSLSNDLIDATKCCADLRLKQSLTLDVCNSIEVLVKDQYGVDKQEFAKMVLTKAFDLNTDEQKIVEEQIAFLFDHNHIKRFGVMRRMFNKVLNVFLKKNLLRNI